MTKERVGLFAAVVGVISLSLLTWWTLSAGTGRPAPCDDVFSHARCELMASDVADSLGVDLADVAAITVVPHPDDGILHTVSGGRPVDTVVTLADGTTRTITFSCAGIPPLSCQDEPTLRASVQTSGYHDVPCTGEAPDGCASPLAAQDPEALAAAVPLTIASVTVPIDHDGRYEVPLGEARIANGILTDTAFEFVDPSWPDDMLIDGGVVRLEVRSLDHPDRPFHNIYERGRVDGVERVQAFLVFDVERHDPGAVLSVRDIVVR